MIHLLAIMVSLCLIVIREKPGRADLWLGLAIGTVAASKAAFNGGVVYLFFLLVDWWKNRRLDPKTYARVGLAGLAIYLISYGVFFLSHNIVEFALLQIKIVRFFRSYLPDYPWFEIFRIIFTGRWRTWFADPPIQPVDSFWPGWPVAISATGLLLAGGFIYKKRTGWPGKETILAAWVATYLIYTSTHLVFPNYLLPILPPAYVCAVFFAWRVVKQIIRKRVAKSGQRERFFPTDS
jgi:hypothetical protein